MRHEINIIYRNFLSCIFFLPEASAQTGVSINSTGTGPDANAILDVSSTDKGVLLPRVTTAQRTAMAPTAASDFGMLVYDTDFDSFWYWDGAAWQEIPNVANTGNTLDEAYDEGGPGAGRVINATNGNVEITGTGFLTVASNVGIGTTGPDRRMKISGTGWTALEVENTDNQDAAIELTSQSVSNYVFTDNTGFLGLESNTGQPIIFRTNGPNERMAVQADGRLRVNNLAEANSAIVISNATGVLNKVPLTGNSTDVLLGTGAFGPASAFDDDDWYKVGSFNTPTAITDYIHTEGHVGIGSNFGPSELSPESPLQVTATGAGNPNTNSIMVYNPTNSAAQDAIIAARVAGSNAGDPFISFDIAVEGAGWSLGIDNDHDNRFKIAPSWNNLSASTALTFQTDGNVGVGTTTPSQKLQVNGIARSFGAYAVDVDGANGSGPHIAWGTTSDVYAFMNLGSYAGINNLETKDRDLRIGSNSAFNAIYLKNSDGNVGLGTSAPTQKLQVNVNNNGINIPVFIRNQNGTQSGGNGVGIGFISEVNDANAVPKAALFHERTTNYGVGKLHFLINSDNASNSSVTLSDARMSILSGGNVGIGTTAPASVFQISTSQTGNVSKLHNPALANGSLVGHEFGKANSTNNMAEFRYNHISDGNAGNWVNLGLWGSANTLNVVGTGNVGIGTTGPAQKLEVAGNTRITGLGGGGDRLVYTNNNGDLYASTGIPSGDADYIWNQSAADQGASFRVSGTGVIGPNSGGVGSSRLKIANSASDFSDFRFSGSGMGQLEFVGWSSGWNINTMTSNKNLYINRDAPSTNNLLLGRSGLETFISGATGNVGIGNTAPGDRLVIENNGVRNASIRFRTDDGTIAPTAYDASQIESGWESGETAWNQSYIKFNTHPANSSAFGTSMTIKGTNVGIGTTTPFQALDVNGRMNVTNGVIQRGGAAITGTSDLGLYSRVSGNWIRYVTNAGAHMWYTDDNIGSTLRMGLDATGNLTVPTGYLTVGNPSVPGATSTSSWNWVYVEEFDNYSYWTQSTCNGSNSFYIPFFSGGYIYYEHENNNDDDWAWSPQIWIPANVDPSQIRASLSAYVCMETSWDGLRLELSINGGAWNVITSFVSGGYNSDADNDCGAGHTVAWSNSSGANYNPVVDLDAQGVQPGDWVRFRLEASTDNSTESCWTDIEVYGFGVEAVGQTNTAAFEAGGIYAAGHIFAHSNSHVGDVAEYFPVVGYSEPGDVIAVDPNSKDVYTVSTSAYNPYVIGVYSTAPSILVNSPDAGEPVGLSGRVPVKVTSEGGPIKIGDYLTSASAKGHAMKATKAGYTIGRALETLEGESGMVMCLIEPGWYNPHTAGTNFSGGSFFAAENQAIVTVDDPAMTRDSRVFVSMLGNPGSNHWVADKQNGRFSINFERPLNNAVKFDYFIDNAAFVEKPTPSAESSISDGDAARANDRKEELADADLSAVVTIDGKTISLEDLNDTRSKDHPQHGNSQALPLMVESEWTLPSPPPNKNEAWIWHPSHGYVQTGKSHTH